MVTIRNETFIDSVAREDLLERVWGPTRFAKTAERLREGRAAADGLSLVALDRGELVGTLRLWHVSAGPGRRALLLGPLAVDAARRCEGIGAALMRRAVGAARRRGHRALLLVGDADYYGRFGFSSDKTGNLWLPGPFEPHRLLGSDLVSGALDGVAGLVSATGPLLPQPSLRALVAGLDRNESSTRRAA